MQDLYDGLVEKIDSLQEKNTSEIANMENRILERIDRRIHEVSEKLKIRFDKIQDAVIEKANPPRV